MNLTDLLADLRRHDKDAMAIFDLSEPVGRPTDLVMPRRRFLDRFRGKKSSSRAAAAVSTPNES
jgi:hypothetical protein